MITKIALANIGATAAALATPAMLFLGVGTGHAAVDLAVWATSAPGGVDVLVETAGGDHGLSGWCSYTSTVQGNPFGKPLPALGVPFYIAPDAPHIARLWFPSYPTGSTWNVTVTCPNGVASTQTVW